jgi:hypothetical protein
MQPGGDGIAGTKYLYLASEVHADTWINGGGPIPIKKASTYLSDSRERTQTPDETLIHDSPVDLQEFKPLLDAFGPFKNLTAIGNSVNGIAMPNLSGVSYYREDGIILSFSNVQSGSVGHRLGHSFCVAIDDMKNLKRIIDDQLTLESVAGRCSYTDGHVRSHFVKGRADSWMNEFRLFWNIRENREFYLPKGVARRIDLKPSDDK